MIDSNLASTFCQECVQWFHDNQGVVLEEVLVACAVMASLHTLLHSMVSIVS